VELVAELAVALVDADDAKAAAFVEGEAGGVLDEDAGDKLPEAALGVSAAERVEGRAAGAGALRGARDVDRVLGDL
jgi:hypothetical protein